MPLAASTSTPITRTLTLTSGGSGYISTISWARVGYGRHFSTLPGSSAMAGAANSTQNAASEIKSLAGIEEHRSRLRQLSRCFIRSHQRERPTASTARSTRLAGFLGENLADGRDLTCK